MSVVWKDGDKLWTPADEHEKIGCLPLLFITALLWVLIYLGYAAWRSL